MGAHSLLSTEDDARQNGFSILCVDDEPAFIRLITAVVRAEGWRTIPATSSREGLRLAQDERPDLILLDHLLPDGRGLELVSELRQRTAAPIILTTVADNEGLLAQAIELADDFMAKPFEVDDLVLKVQSLLGAPPPGRLSVVIQQGNLIIDLRMRRSKLRERSLVLSHTEWLLLEDLAAGEIRFDQELLVRLWGPRYREDSAVLEACVQRLIEKTEVTSPPLIERVADVGYRLSPSARVSS